MNLQFFLLNRPSRCSAKPIMRPNGAPTMKKNITNTNAGFTLIEFLLYIGLTGVMVLVIGAIGLNILLSSAKHQVMEEVADNGRRALDVIGQSVTNAIGVNSPTVGTTSTSLSLQMADAAKNPTIFDLSSGTLRITEGVGSPVAITSSKITVTSMQFTNVAASGVPGAIRTQITLQHVNPQNRPEYVMTKTFYTTSTIKKR